MQAPAERAQRKANALRQQNANATQMEWSGNDVTGLFRRMRDRQTDRRIETERGGEILSAAKSEVRSDCTEDHGGAMKRRRRWRDERINF